MQQVTAVNNMYAAYTTSSNVDRKNISELSRLAKEMQGEDEAIDKELMMDKVIISKEALQMLKAARSA